MSSLKPPKARRHPAQRLGILLGRWDIQLIFPDPAMKPLRGSASFRWLVKDGLMELRSRFTGKGGKPPTSVATLGADEADGAYTMLYWDERQVVRIYQMTLTAREWTLTRKAPGFWQRFRGRFGSGGRTIRASWEKSANGKRWEHDFDLIYTRKSR